MVGVIPSEKPNKSRLRCHSPTYGHKKISQLSVDITVRGGVNCCLLIIIGVSLKRRANDEECGSTFMPDFGVGPRLSAPTLCAAARRTNGKGSYGAFCHGQSTIICSAISPTRLSVSGTSFPKPRAKMSCPGSNCTWQLPGSISVTVRDQCRIWFTCGRNAGRLYH